MVKGNFPNLFFSENWNYIEFLSWRIYKPVAFKYICWLSFILPDVMLSVNVKVLSFFIVKNRFLCMAHFFRDLLKHLVRLTFKVHIIKVV